MKKKVLFLLLVIYCLLRISPGVYADYVLPYPSYMPGNKLYQVSRVLDTVKKWWYWGSIASFKYHLSLSDKYLVEAKTLFEYKQYVLALKALERSDTEFKQLPAFIGESKSENKNIQLLRQMGIDAAGVHIETIAKFIPNLPEQFLWEPEKSTPSLLPIGKLLRESVCIRE